MTFEQVDTGTKRGLTQPDPEADPALIRRRAALAAREAEYLYGLADFYERNALVLNAKQQEANKPMVSETTA